MKDDYQSCFLSKRCMMIAGVDEVGCGSLAGPVIASAVILRSELLCSMNKLSDSKSLRATQRLKLYRNIIQCALTWSIGEVNVLEIDRLNILKARLLAMKRAIYNLAVIPDLVLVDGNYSPKLKNIFSQCFVKGDIHIPLISLASIVAKVIRDQNMMILDNQYPEYGFLKNKGYPTSFHVKQLYLYGPTVHHRKTFAPVKYIM